MKLYKLNGRYMPTMYPVKGTIIGNKKIKNIYISVYTWQSKCELNNAKATRELYK